ncbi:MAG: PAS domain S-box protein [Ignavibacteriales bacterium]|nr:MAG: PAS domain S-box protein [Ignavibacteriales bacterium]
MKNFNRFPRKYYILISGLAMVIAAISIFYYDYRQTAVVDGYAASLEALTELKKDILVKWNDERLDYAKMISNDKRIADFLISANTGSAGKSDIEALVKSISHYRYSDELLNISLVDSKYELIYSIADTHKVFYESIEPLLARAKLSGKIEISEIHQPEDYDIHHSIMVPVYRNHKFVGSLITEFSLKNIFTLAVPKWPFSTSTGETLIATQDGDNVRFISKLINEKTVDLKLETPMSDSLPASMAIKGKRGIVEGFDYKNDEVLAYVDSIPGTNYVIVSKINKSEIDLSLSPARIYIFISAVILFAAVLSIIIGQWKVNTAKFYKEQLKLETEKNKLQTYNDFLSKYANDMIFLINEEGKILDANEKACNVYGYSKEEFLTMHSGDVRIESERTYFEEHLKHINEHDGYIFETSHKTKNGKTFPVEVSSRFFQVDGQKYIQAIVRDISERQSAADSLRKSEQRFRTFAETSDDVIYIYRTTPKLHFEFVSPSLENVLGYKPEEFYNNPLFELQLIHPDDSANIFGNYKSPSEQKSQVIRYIAKDGHTVWMEQTRIIHFDRSQNIEFIYSSARDITKRIMIQKSLEKSEHRYKSLAKFLPVGMYRADFAGNCLYVNEKWCELTGMTPDEAFGKGWLKSIYPADKDLVLNKWKQLLENNETISAEYRLIKSDNSIVWVLGSVTSEFDSEGNTSGFVGSVTDISEIKLMEETIRYQNLRYDTLLKSTAAAVHILDGNGNVIQANDAFCKLLGYTSDEALMLNVSDWNESYSGEVFQIAKKEVFEKPNLFESTMKMKNGTTIDAEISATGIKFNDQEMIFCTALDITERKKIQKQIADSELKFRSLYELANDAILLIDPETYRILDCNPAAEELFGMDENSIIGKMPADLSPAIQPDGSISEIISEYYLKKCNENGFVRFEWEHYRFFEQPLNVEVSLKKINMDNNGLVQAIIRDMSNLKKHEEQIKLLFRSIEQSPTSVVITDINGNIEYANPKCLELTGYTREEVTGQNPRILQSGQTPKEIYEQMWQTILNGEEWRGEFLNRKKNGALYWETAVISPVKNDTGEILHFVAVKEDVTERKIMESELLKAKEKAEEMNKLKSAFLANMSHELRTPLVGILGGASIINEESNEPEIKEFSELILNSAKRLNDTLNSIIDISKIESSQQPVRICELNIAPILKEIISPFIAQAEAKKLTFNYSNGIDSAFVFADESLFNKSVNYVINNAIKFTEKGHIDLSLEQIDHSFVIKVADTGIGIPDSFRQNIFSPFRQASEGLSRKFEGNGLGLAITKKFVELMNGEIWFESIEGAGTTFYMKFRRVNK